ncbi:polysaccharide deacetylase family protein [Paenibacillus piri]|uniref:Polysaccharide deacetylase family protein n=2 Tax=Paenibacillus piri TaxID=2547395 RepID=A0A4V2ZSR8_9BACL|nr:polysaccharide deacetylase family protein [Paenibacillus piri]
MKKAILTVCCLFLCLSGELRAGAGVRADADAPKKGRFYYEKRGEVVWEVPTDEKVIALTFDDGPDPEDTPKILELLKQYEAKATFFIVGKKAEAYPEILGREDAEGHELANHTYHHIYFNRSFSEKTITDEISRAEEVIYKRSGQKPRLFRPPGGFYNDALVRVAKNSGYKVVMWSWHINTMDWNTPGVDKIAKTVLNNARNGDIVLLHDWVEGKSQTVEALKQILPELKNRGYRFVTISELLTYSRLSPVRLMD